MSYVTGRRFSVKNVSLSFSGQLQLSWETVGACAACRTDGYVILLEPNHNIRGTGSSPSPWGHLAFIYNALISCELEGQNNFSWDSHPWNCRIVKGALSMINHSMLIHFGSTTSQTKNWHGRSVQL